MKFSAEQNEARMKGVGASEAAGVLGLSKWESPMSIYLRKIGAGEEVEENEPMYWGSKKEPIIRERFAEDHPEFRVIPGLDLFDGGILASKETPFIFASPDAVLDDKASTQKGSRLVAGLEIKTATQFKANDWPESGHADGVPADYWVQCQQCMYVTGLDKWYLAVLIGSADYREYLIGRDDEFITGLVEKLGEFWKLVEARTPPPFDGSDASKRVLDTLYPVEDTILEPAASLPSESDMLAEELLQVKQLMKGLTADQKRIENTLKGMMGDNALAYTPEGYEVTWKPYHRDGYTVEPTDYRKFAIKRNEE